MVLKSKTIIDLSMASDFGVEAVDEITSRLLHKRSPTKVIPEAWSKKVKTMKNASTNDDMEMQFSLLLSFTPPYGGEADPSQPPIGI